MKTKQLPFLLLLVALLPAFGFKTVSKAQNYRIVVGVAYGDMNCSGLTVKTALGYEYRTTEGGSTSELTAQVRSDAARENGISTGDVVIKTGYKPHALIISYKKKISGWNCEKTMYGVGFGNTYDEAKNDAVRTMESSNASYSTVKHISVY